MRVVTSLGPGGAKESPHRRGGERGFGRSSDRISSRGIRPLPNHAKQGGCRRNKYLSSPSLLSRYLPHWLNLTGAEGEGAVVMQFMSAGSQGEGRDEQVESGCGFSVNITPAQPARLLGLLVIKQQPNSK